MPDEPTRTLLYDEDCGFCRWSLDKILLWDRGQTLRPLPIQSEEGQRLLAPIPEEKRLDSFHVVEPDGEIRSAGAAAPSMLSGLSAGKPLAALTRSMPGATERAYRLVAGNRTRISKALGIDASCELRR